MIRLTVKEKTYKKDTNWRELNKDADKCLVASVDIEDDEQVPVREYVPGEWFFTKDFTCRLYSVKSTIEGHTPDAHVIDVLLYMRIYDSKELRYWFHDVPTGEHILETSWESIDGDDEQYLKFEGTYADIEV